MPHSERPKVRKHKRPRCTECGYKIRRDGVLFQDQDYHRPCLERIAPRLSIHHELVRMGLDQPPPAAA